MTKFRICKHCGQPKRKTQRQLNIEARRALKPAEYEAWQRMCAAQVAAARRFHRELL